MSCFGNPYQNHVRNENIKISTVTTEHMTRLDKILSYTLHQSHILFILIYSGVSSHNNVSQLLVCPSLIH
ncbi:hypothetical protein M2265_001041 [Sphingobacterium kitahiroshimense]|nr:hypothetical protein [Sphingobacterium kitahiroshimense]